MTEDPLRWVDDDDAPDGMRAYLEDARAPEGLAPDVRAAIREAVLSAAERDADRSATVRPLVRRSPIAPSVLGLALLAAVILLGVVLYPSDAPMTVPAVGPEPIDAGPDAPALDVIEVERVCGDREDSDLQCDLVVRPGRSYERIELIGRAGIEPPTCDGIAEQHREPVEGELRFVLSHGGSRDGLRAFAVCGYAGGVLLGVGAIDGERNLPWLSLGRRRGGDDVRIPLDAIDGDITSLELRWIADVEDHASHPEDGCPGTSIATLSRAELDALGGREGIGLFRHVRIAEVERPTYVLCAHSARGAHHVRMPHRFPDEDQPFVRTRSGEVSLDQVDELEALGPDGLVMIDRVDAAWPGSAARRRQIERTLAAMAERGAPGPRLLELENGQRLALPRGAALAHASPSMATLRDGSTVRVLRETPIGPAGSESEDVHWTVRGAVLTSRSSARVYLDDVEVTLFATDDEAPRAIDPAPPEPIRVVPRVAYECAVEVLLELDALPASDIESVAVAFVRAAPGDDLRGPAPIDCAHASIATELPTAALRALEADERGMRQLSLTFSGAPADFDDLRDDGTYCDAPFAVIACVRDAAGLRPLAGAEGRWAFSGMACFSGDTPVATDDGAAPIASLAPGDRVLAFDPNRGSIVTTRVTRLLPRGERALLTLTLSHGGVLRVTAEHPLFDATRGRFRAAAAFAIGDRLRGIDGRDVAVRAIDRGERAEVFDLSVGGPHTYFAGGIVAHNY